MKHEFKPGEEKKGGRKPGSRNKITKELRGNIEKLIRDNFEGVEKAMKMLSEKSHTASAARQFIEIWTKLHTYVVPQMQRQTINHKGEGIPVQWVETKTYEKGEIAGQDDTNNETNESN